MEEAPYDSETLLQRLLADHPDLLAGDQIDAEEPRRWLLICREMAVPGEEDGAGRWSLDHLYLDQDAIPTLVEVKRSSDSRIRREVVGQMLDYAANAVVYWPVEEIRKQFEKTCEAYGTNPEETLLAFLGPDSQSAEFWNRVKTNLQAAKIRMVFVADEIPAELRRVVEFLNEQMDPAEVLAIEVRQFVGQGHQALVPVVLGQTAGSQLRKGKERRQWDEPSFVAVLEERGDTEGRRAVDAILEWARRRELRIVWGTGATYGSMMPVLDNRGTDYAFFRMFNGTRKSYLEIEFGLLRTRPIYEDSSRRAQLR